MIASIVKLFESFIALATPVFESSGIEVFNVPLVFSVDVTNVEFSELRDVEVTVEFTVTLTEEELADTEFDEETIQDERLSIIKKEIGCLGDDDYFFSRFRFISDFIEERF